ncbi:hypothetical protein QTP70_023935 [Hemibagrus guttatus]|uniref:ribonuclease H n=1 Tax=Hemibagrus guttatus TaxID=175788 RepID=A0AAE0UJ75_9TELE|nr:hypothetical protein QTP70_023935 [Hemibagrus guttatus]
MSDVTKTVQKWHASLKKGTDFDSWGQLVEAIDEYQILARQLQKEVQSSNSQDFTEEQKKTLGKIAACLEMRSSSLQSTHSQEEFTLQDLKKLEPIIKNILTYNKDFPFDVQPVPLRKIFAPGEEENLDVEEELDTATGTVLIQSFPTRVSGSDLHEMVVCRMTLMVCKKKRSKIQKKTKWWKLKKEECCEEFRQKLRQALGGQVVLPDDWETTAEVIRETGRKVLGVSSGRRKEDKETWWWNEEVQDSIQRKRLAKKKWDMDRTEENRQEYKELQRRVKREVSKAKQKAYDELYTRLDTREGEKDLYRLARQRDRDGKDVQQVRVIKDRDGRVLTSEESVQRRWKEYFEELMNEENEREKRVEGVNSVEQKVDKIRKDEVRKALKMMKSGKAVGPDDIPVEVWKCLGEAAVEFLASLFNRVLESERMPEEWRRSVLVPIFKNKGDVQSCSNYRGIKLMSHTMKVWERVVEARLRKVVDICEQQYGFMPRKSTTDAIFALRILMEKYRDGQRELHCVFVDLEKAYDRVPREELWYCMRKSGVAEKYVRVVQDMYERSRTVVRCAVGQTEEFKVEVGLHQGSALSPFLFAIVMDQLSEEVRQESPWTMMFAEDIVICSESREKVEENLERWRFALERRGMKVSRSKTEYMCVNEREGSGTVRLQGEEVKKVQEFKYLGSTVQSNGECGKEVKKREQAGTLLPRLPSEPGMTLLTLKIERIGLKDAGQCIEPYMTISVRDLDGVELNPVQDTPVSTHKEDTYIHFGVDVEIQKHIEKLPKGAAIFFEFKHYKPKKKFTSTKCFAFMEMDEIKPGPIVIELYKKPTDFKRKKLNLLTKKPLYLHLHQTLHKD